MAVKKEAAAPEEEIAESKLSVVEETSAPPKAPAKKADKAEKAPEPENKDSDSDDDQQETAAAARKRSRLKISDFFSRDILGSPTKDRLKYDLNLKTRSGMSLFRMIYDRQQPDGRSKASIDSYLHRPKEIASLSIARDKNEQIIKMVDNRISELEAYVNKRHKQVSRIYDQVTSIEKYELEGDSITSVETGFSTSHSRRFLEVIKNIDDAFFMAGYLEKVGHFDMNQEMDLTTSLYRRTMTDARIIMTFIGRAVISVRKELRS